MSQLNLAGAKQILETLVTTRNRMVRRLSILETRKQEAENEAADIEQMIALADNQIENVRGLIARYQEAEKNG